MSSSIKTIIIAAALMATAFAGLGLVAEDVDGDAAPVYTTDPVKFAVGTGTYWKNVEQIGDSNIKLPTLADLGCTLADGKEFKGWYIDEPETGYTDEPCYPAGTVVAYVFEEDPADNAIFTAYLADITYTVTFIEEGKEDVVKTGILNAPQTAPTPTVPAGYVFGGWLDAEGNALVLEDNGFAIKGDATYTATFVIDPAVTFIVDDVTIYSSTVDKAVMPSDPVKDDFTFLGWAVDGEIAIAAGAPGTAIKDLELETATVFVAVFEPALHTVTFAVDGVAVSTQTVRHGELATEPALIPAKEGYDFAGWDYDFTAPVTADVTIAATFTEKVAPAPEGLDDPVTMTLVIIGSLVALIVLAALVNGIKKGKIIIGRGPNAKGGKKE